MTPFAQALNDPPKYNQQNVRKNQLLQKYDHLTKRMMIVLWFQIPVK